MASPEVGVDAAVAAAGTAERVRVTTAAAEAVKTVSDRRAVGTPALPSGSRARAGPQTVERFPPSSLSTSPVSATAGGAAGCGG